MSNGNKVEVEITGDSKGLVTAGKQSETALAGVRKATDQVGAANAASSQAAKDYIAALQREAAQLGMTATQKRVYESATKGASRADQDAVRTLSDKIEAHGRAEKAIQMVGRAAAIAGAAIGAGLVAMLKGSVTAAQEAEQAMLKLNAVFKASGGASGMTRGGLDNIANDMKERTGFDDDVIRNAMSRLLSFRNVGGEAFREVMNTAADLSRLLDQDLNSSVMMLGKALENPVEGLTAMTRAGVSFSESQKQAIEQMVKSGDQAGAMTEILKTLREQGINGVAEAMNTGLFKATNDARMAWDDLLKTIGNTAVVKGSTEATLGSWAGYLSDMKRVIDDGDWLDRLAFFTIGMTTPSMMKGNQWEGSVGGKEAREAREKLEAQKIRNQDSERERFALEFETPKQKRDRELARANALFAGRPELPGMLSAVNAKYADKPKATSKTSERGIDDEDDVLYRIQEAARLKNKKAFDEGDRAREREAAALETLRKRYVDMADPLQKYRDDLDEIEKLKQLGRENGGLDGDQALQAAWKVNEAMDQQIEKMNDLGAATQEADNFARDMGLSFSSAFEDAIIEGRKFSDVVQGLGRDIARIVLRKTVTEPLGGMVSEFVKNLKFPGFASGGEFAGGYRIVGENGPELEATGPSRIFNAGQTRDILGGGAPAPVTVNVIEDSSRGGQTQQRQGPGGGNVLDVFVSQIRSVVAGDIASGRGPIPAAMESTYGANRAAGAF